MAATATSPLGAALPRLGAEERAALGALAFLALASAGWWALALWPAPNEPPAWLERARWVCFNTGASGMPSASGWLLLVGEPLGLGVALWAAFGRSLRSGSAKLARSSGGRAGLAAGAALLALGIAAAGARIVTLARASSGDEFAAAQAALPDPSALPHLDRPAPALDLVDQHGARITLDALRGRPALVTFAFAHCEAVCPALVSQARSVQREARARGEAVPRLAIVTLDPWRDTPARLPALAASWRLGADAHVLSGEPDLVNTTLDAWNVPREREASTGQLAHPALVYVLDARGRIAFASNGDARTLSALLARVNTR
jgi:protein SCO1/2